MWSRTCEEHTEWWQAGHTGPYGPDFVRGTADEDLAATPQGVEPGLDRASARLSFAAAPGQGIRFPPTVSCARTAVIRLENGVFTATPAQQMRPFTGAAATSGTATSRLRAWK
jgi:hypothetical protein